MANMNIMTEEWAMLWYQCLSENYDYSIYSDARVNDDVEVSKSFEKKFEKISEIYEDFGRISSLDSLLTDSWQWREWFEPRKKLFMPDVKVVSDLTESLKANEILLKIPMQTDLESTLEEVRKELSRIYETKRPTTAYTAKYQLKKKTNGRTEIGFEAVRQAVITSVGKYADIIQSRPEETPINEVVLFLERNIGELGWSIDPHARAQLSEGIIDPNRAASYRSMLSRSRATFRVLSSNTIRGIFPDASKRSQPESLVWDRFLREPRRP